MSQQNSGRLSRSTWAATALREVISIGGQAQTTIAKVNAANFSASTRTGNVAQRLQNTRTDTGMWQVLLQIGPLVISPALLQH